MDAEEQQRDQGKAQYIEERWSQLSDLEAASVAEAWKYLTLVNAGGATATIALMGALGTVKPEVLPTALAILTLFTVGLILVGIGRALSYYQTNRLFSQWRKDVETFYAQNLDFGNLLRNDNQRCETFLRCKKIYWAELVAWLSFLCIIGAVATGGYALWMQI